MPKDKKQKKFTRDEVDYRHQTYNYHQKCEKCDNRDRVSLKCEILVDRDNDVSNNGWCNKFKPGKHLIIDLQDQEELDRRRAVWKRQNEIRIKKIRRP